LSFGTNLQQRNAITRAKAEKPAMERFGTFTGHFTLTITFICATLTGFHANLVSVYVTRSLNLGDCNCRVCNVHTNRVSRQSSVSL